MPLQPSGMPFRLLVCFLPTQVPPINPHKPYNPSLPLMKHTLLIAGIFTIFFAIFLVWADNLLANHFENQKQRAEFGEEVLGIELPGDTSSPTDRTAESRSVPPPQAEPVCLP